MISSVICSYFRMTDQRADRSSEWVELTDWTHWRVILLVVSCHDLEVLAWWDSSQKIPCFSSLRRVLFSIQTSFNPHFVAPYPKYQCNPLFYPQRSSILPFPGNKLSVSLHPGSKELKRARRDLSPLNNF